jgi:iron complex outermembrane recepter protein
MHQNRICGAGSRRIAGRGVLLTGAAILSLMAVPAAAQDTAAAPDAPQTQDGQVAPAQQIPNAEGEIATNAADQSGEDIVVTGSILRSTTSATVSPVTVINSEALDQRGINTVQDALQQLASNNGPALTNSFTANGAFASGASAVSLRGLSTNSTLVLFDGQRAASYPLADDGSRNFVDLNTIPDDIVDRIEVLRDGASSTYGADAVAGVVNIITKRTFRGVGGRAEAGIAQDGLGANYRLSLTAGVGDLNDQGFNAYVSGFYYRSESVYNRDLRYPFNTDDERGVCLDGVCGPDVRQNARNAYSGQLSTFNVNGQYNVYVQPYDATNTTPVAGSRYELLNPAAGCLYGTGYQLTAAELAANPLAPAATPLCRVDLTNEFGVASPEIERFGGSGRVTAKLGDDVEAYAMVNFQQTVSSFTGAPPVVRGQANAGILFRPFSTQSGPSAALAPGSFALTLPVYVCANGVGDASGLNTGCNAANGVLNPNNPFAAQGQVARVLGRPIQQPVFNSTRSRVYRAAFGVNASVFDDWDLRVEGTAMHNDLRRTQQGYVYIANLLTSVAQGTFNFVNPAANTQQTLDFVSPDNINDLSSDLYALQTSVSGSLFDLPGGPLQLGVGAQIRYEAVDAPSANPDYNGAAQRFYTINAFGTTGSRTVYSAFAELNAPVIEQLEVNASGRYDSYSSGQNAFSPKIGAKFTPFRQLAVRATYSRGFRIPAFGEANALPTTGFVTVATNTLPASFLSQYSVAGNPAGACAPTNSAGCPAYITVYSRGSTTLASPDLDPEKSRSITAGIVVSPVRNFTFTVDYFNIKKTGAITNLPIQPALDAYFAGQAIPAGYAVIPDAADPNFPTALPRPAFVEAQLVNANTIRSEGLDFAASANFEVGDFRITASGDVSYIIDLSTSFPDGTTQSYEGTLGNFALTAGSGTPEWHGNFQSTVEYGGVSLTGNVNWFGGYDLSAEDETGPGTAGQCGLAPDPQFVPCRVDDYITLDLTAQFRVSDRFTFYVNALNVLDELPPVDPVTYGAHLYNPVQGGSGVFGRAFRAGVRIGL